MATYSRNAFLAEITKLKNPAKIRWHDIPIRNIRDFPSVCENDKFELSKTLNLIGSRPHMIENLFKFSNLSQSELFSSQSSQIIRSMIAQRDINDTISDVFSKALMKFPHLTSDILEICKYYPIEINIDSSIDREKNDISPPSPILSGDEPKLVWKRAYFCELREETLEILDGELINLSHDMMLIKSSKFPKTHNPIIFLDNTTYLFNGCVISSFYNK